jgi:murein tripeptide amidase MpaA
LTITNFNDNEQ